MNHFISFQQTISHLSPPPKFTFPFYYEPHPLAKLAASELQDHLKSQSDWEHNFGLTPDKKGLKIAKMFGVLVVRNKENTLGYLAAFSGKLANKNILPHFVPPIYNNLDENGFYLKEEAILMEITSKIVELESDPKYKLSTANLESMLISQTEDLIQIKSVLKDRKKNRKHRRTQTSEKLSSKELETLKLKLENESLHDRFYIKELKFYYAQKLQDCKSQLRKYLIPLELLRKERADRSMILQKRILAQYNLLNIEGNFKSLTEIFDELSIVASSGTGDCAAPKLLQYAFLNELTPIALAEFWWGNSEIQTIRKHRNFYPACKGKCEPILTHMLEGLEMDENLLIVNLAKDKAIETIYEDDEIVIINKPTELLSVPGKTIKDSVFTRISKKYPLATGPLIVHRLDMSTSGIMIIAKTKESHRFLQSQFIKRTIKKRYVAVLDGVIDHKEGNIELPLRVDLDDRPRQLVCHEHGKSALTHYKVIETIDNKTKIHFFPVSGRTHQLRVHAAHSLGLNTPIIGDDLYGTKGTRLHLHAGYIRFIHPKSGTELEFYLEENFED